MREPDGAPEGRGRLHGRMLQLLGIVPAVAALIALWQFGVFGGEPDPDEIGSADGPETMAISGAPDATSTAAATPTASSTSETPSESTPAETSAAPSTDASSAEPPASTTTVAEVEETVQEGAACSASLELNEEWDGMVEVNVEVVNTGGEALESWEIDLDLDDADITHYWGMRHLDGDRFGSEDWNGRLDPDENAVTGFQAKVDRHFDLPESVDCTART